jgi:SAM-dependent methyltransferase
MTVRGFKEGWMSVDGDADPRRYVRLMDMARGGRDGDPAQYRGVFDTLAVVEGERVLDVGCGTGGAVRALAATVGGVGRVVGLDVSRTMARSTRPTRCASSRLSATRAACSRRWRACCGRAGASSSTASTWTP